MSKETRLFVDNIGTVSIINKRMAIPANLEVQLSTSGGELDEAGLWSSGFSCFITSFKSIKKSQYELKTSLDHKTHIIPFGEAPEAITLSGITFGFSQISKTSGAGMRDVYSLSIPADRRFIPKLNETKTDVVPSVTAEAENKPGDEYETSLFKKTAQWIDNKKNADSGLISGVSNKIGSSLLPIGSAASSVIGGVGSLANKALSAVNDVSTLMGKISALPGQAVGKLLDALGLNILRSTGSGIGAEAQLPMSTNYNASFFPLSFPEINLLFDYMQLGSVTRVYKDAMLKINYNGVIYSCAIDSMTFDAKEAVGSIQFNMTLICLESAKYYDSIAPTEPVVTSGSAGVSPLMGQAKGAILGAAGAAIRSKNPKIGPVSLGRLLG